MTDDDALERVRTARVARLATVGDAGRPHIVPVCFVLDTSSAPARVYSVIDDKPKRRLEVQRLANVRANPAVELVVDHYDDADWSALWWVRVNGQGRVVDHGDERERAIDQLAVKYAQYRERRPRGAVLAVDIERTRHWQAAR